MTENIYSGFSNYNEINIENRKKSVEKELDKWADEKGVYLQYRKAWNRAANESYLPKHPLHIDIELSDVCNLKCEMCAHGMRLSKNAGFMDQDLVCRLIDQAVDIGTYALKFNWRGEATLNRFLPEAVRYAKEKGILEVSINTNGLPVYENMLLKIAESGIDRMIFSVDGFSSKTYESIRIGGNYDKLLHNILSVVKWKIDRDSNKPFLRVQMVRSKKNFHEVKNFISFWQGKVNDVRISDVMDRGQGDRLSVGDQITIGRRRCPQPFQRLVVGRDGAISPCCADWNQQYVVGNVNESSLLEIWNGKIMNRMREIQNKMQHSSIDICRNCYVKESFIWKKNG